MPTSRQVAIGGRRRAPRLFEADQEIARHASRIEFHPSSVYSWHALTDIRMRRSLFLLLAGFVAYTSLFQNDWSDFGQPKVVNPKTVIRISIGALIDGNDNERITSLLTYGSLHLAFYPSLVPGAFDHRFPAEHLSFGQKIYLLHGVMLI